MVAGRLRAGDGADRRRLSRWPTNSERSDTSLPADWLTDYGAYFIPRHPQVNLSGALATCLSWRPFACPTGFRLARFSVRAIIAATFSPARKSTRHGSRQRTTLPFQLRNSGYVQFCPMPASATWPMPDMTVPVAIVREATVPGATQPEPIIPARIVVDQVPTSIPGL